MESSTNSASVKGKNTDDPPSNVEGIRQKRLAYFGSNKHEEKSKVQSSPPSTHNNLPIDTLNIPRTQSNGPQQSAQLPSQHKFSPSANNQTASYTSGSVPLPQQSRDPTHTMSNNSRLHLNINHHNIDKSDFDKISVFKSLADINELGLATHRPESSVSGEINREIFQPCEMTRTSQELYGDRTLEMKKLLGEQGFQELMMKNNQDFERGHKSTTRSRSLQHTDPLPGSSSINNVDWRENNPVSSPRFSNVNKAKKEREFVPLNRSSDQVIVPKSTRNSYSSEEIYREAYSHGKPPDAASSNLMQNYPQYPGSIPQTFPHPPVNQNAISDHSNIHVHRHRKQNPVENPNSHPGYPALHPSMNPFSHPPPPVHYPLKYESHFQNGISHPKPPSYHPQKPSYDFPSQYTIIPNQERLLNYTQDHFYPSTYSNSNQSFIPHSLGMAAVSVSKTFNGQPGPSAPVFKYPTNGVPLHLPPPPIPESVNKQESLPQNPLHYVAPMSARRSSVNSQLSFQGYQVLVVF